MDISDAIFIIQCIILISGIIYNSKMVRCAVTLNMSFAQCWNCEYRTVNKTTLLNSACIVPSRTNVNNLR